MSQTSWDRHPAGWCSWRLSALRTPLRCQLHQWRREVPVSSSPASTSPCTKRGRGLTYVVVHMLHDRRYPHGQGNELPKTPARRAANVRPGQNRTEGRGVPQYHPTHSDADQDAVRPSHPRARSALFPSPPPVPQHSQTPAPRSIPQPAQPAQQGSRKCLGDAVRGARKLVD
jgi:hypothetical protein